jgi:hypothetical protein
VLSGEVRERRRGTGTGTGSGSGTSTSTQAQAQAEARTRMTEDVRDAVRRLANERFIVRPMGERERGRQKHRERQKGAKRSAYVYKHI